MEENKNEIQNNVNVDIQTNEAPQQNNSNTPNEKKDKVDIKKIIIVVIVVVAIIGLVLFLVLKKGDEPTPTPGGDLTQKSEISKKVYKINDLKYLVEIKNNKSSVVDLDVSLYIYGENKEVLNYTQKNIKALGIGETSYLVLDYAGYENNEYEVKIENEVESDTSKVFTKQLVLEHKNVENEIDFTLKNNSTSKVDIINFEVIYFKNNEIVKYKTLGYNDLEAGQKIADLIYTPTYDNGEEIDFDKYEITFRAYN